MTAAIISTAHRWQLSCKEKNSETSNTANVKNQILASRNKTPYNNKTLGSSFLSKVFLLEYL